MLSFEEWEKEGFRLRSIITEIEDRIEYRKLELGCGEPGVCRRLTEAQQELIDNDMTLKELRYMRNNWIAKRDYLRANGVLPPGENADG